MPGTPVTANYLLSHLSAGEIKRLMAVGKVTDRRRGDRLQTTGDDIDQFVFPLTGMVSLTIDTSEGQTVEVAIVGREGFAGVSRYLGRPKADTNAVMQIAGQIVSFPHERLLEVAAANPSFRAAVDRFLRSMLVETAQSAVCNQMHSVEQRTARWLLHASDRAGTNDLHLTHEFLSQMLAVRRAGVTAVIGIFNRALLTSTQRGLILISDREGLGELTCECYGIVRAATPV